MTTDSTGPDVSSPVTLLLAGWSKGDPQALSRLVTLLYDELRRLAKKHLARERPEHTLGATALVHEVYLRLADQAGITVENRAHFLHIASHAMRRVLVDHARARSAAKRNCAGALPLDEGFLCARMRDRDLIALDDALDELSKIDSPKCRLVELRFFGGLSVEEAAEVLGISGRTAAREWNIAKAWLYAEIRRDQGAGAPAR